MPKRANPESPALRCSMCDGHILFFRSLADNLRGKAEILRKQNDGYMQHSCLDLARIIDEHIQRTSNAALTSADEGGVS